MGHCSKYSDSTNAHHILLGFICNMVFCWVLYVHVASSRRPGGETLPPRRRLLPSSPSSSLPEAAAGQVRATPGKGAAGISRLPAIRGQQGGICLLVVGGVAVGGLLSVVAWALARRRRLLLPRDRRTRGVTGGGGSRPDLIGGS
jgi:hypothetical protein